MEIPTSLEALVERYDGNIRSVLSKVSSLNSADLDDAVQDVYVRFAKHNLLNRYVSNRSAFTSYLYMVCQSVARNRHRTSTRRIRFRNTESYREVRCAVQPPSQEWELLFSECHAYLAEQHPELLPAITRLIQTGRLRDVDAEKLRDALMPVYA